MGTTVKATFAFFIAVAAIVPAGMTSAQPFPSKSLRIIVPFPPGGAADIMARILTESMAKALGQSVIVDNRPGAGAVIGYELVARAPADGYTVLQVWPSFVINPALRQGLSYDPFKDFKAVGQAVSMPMAVAVHPSLPAKSLQELIALARARPGDLGYAIPGMGTIQHIFGEMVKIAVNINITPVPYQGGVAMMTATAGGHIPIIINNVTDIAPFAIARRVRAIVVTAPERAEALPDVPTLRDAGYPQLEATNWSGFVVPTATPPSVITRLNTEIVRTLRSTQAQEKLKAQNLFASPSTSEQFAALLQSESARFTKVVQQAGIKLD